ncbi:MAG: helix-turn-helix domain-containing protein [Acidobacteria bacterium]|nr:helix-turn-helix domain-containing protein [Acidobacteriota bacterium]
MSDDILNQVEVAQMLKVSTMTVRRWRYARTGPAFFKLGKLVRYRRAAVVNWVDSGAPVASLN